MPLTHIQSQLQGIYDLRLDHRVEDFLITDEAQVDRLEQCRKFRSTQEKLLISEYDGELFVSLYLAEELLETLETNNPYRRLESKNLREFCTVLEGVSHFIYLTWNATHDRSISRLELELQAEVDKFVSIFLLSGKQGSPIPWGTLSTWLFDRCHYDSALGPDELHRYKTANKLAREFCRRLEPCFDSEGLHYGIIKELRRFYRKRHHEKLTSAGGDVLSRSP